MKCENADITSFAPGTAVERSRTGVSAFAQFENMIRMTDGLTLGQVCAITGLEPSAVQNWVKRGFVPRPVGKKYYGRQLARIMLINALRDSMKIENVGELMRSVNGDTEDESDDIISEERFYDYLCRAFDSCENEFFEQDVRDTVAGIASEDESLDAALKKRLTDALCAMAYAYAAGILIRKSSRYFNESINQ